ncbi:MAG: hypothetical protein KGZ37_00055 [Nitrosarchaeum sp.]|nr:hypothetical protein [Nitrosarchaeum sp.]
MNLSEVICLLSASQSSDTPLTLRDFQPINTWELDQGGQQWQEGKEAGLSKFIIDKTTGRGYLNETKKCIRLKCLALIFASPLVHPITSIINVVHKTLKLVSLSYFWMNIDNTTKYNFKARLYDAGKDLLRIITTPLSIVGLELAAIYGLLRPHDGRKIYATLERAMYNNFPLPKDRLAPCFQPHPTSHGLGGSIDRRDSW